MRVKGKLVWTEGNFNPPSMLAEIEIDRLPGRTKEEIEKKINELYEEHDCISIAVLKELASWFLSPEQAEEKKEGYHCLECNREMCDDLKWICVMQECRNNFHRHFKPKEKKEEKSCLTCDYYSSDLCEKCVQHSNYSLRVEIAKPRECGTCAFEYTLLESERCILCIPETGRKNWEPKEAPKEKSSSGEIDWEFTERDYPITLLEKINKLALIVREHIEKK